MPIKLVMWPKYWSFSFSISPSNEHSGLISFRIDWFDLLAVQGTLKGFSQHHNSKASILWHSSFFIVQLSHPYMTKHLLIPWLQSPSAVILEPNKINLSLFPLFPLLFTMKWGDKIWWSWFFECWILRQLFHTHTHIHAYMYICIHIQAVKNLPAMQETWFRSLDWQNPWRREWLPISVFLKIPWTGEPGRLQSTGSQRVRHDWATQHSTA